jgi:hypothetical protein
MRVIIDVGFGRFDTLKCANSPLLVPNTKMPFDFKNTPLVMLHLILKLLKLSYEFMLNNLGNYSSEDEAIK